MHYIAFLIMWLPLPPDAPPELPPRAAFLKHFPTYRECADLHSRLVDQELKRATTCILVVVEPKVGISE